MSSITEWTTEPTAAAACKRRGYPRFSQISGYAAELSAHRRGHASNSERRDTLVDEGSSGHVSGGAATHGVRVKRSAPGLAQLLLGGFDEQGIHQ